MMNFKDIFGTLVVWSSSALLLLCILAWDHLIETMDIFAMVLDVLLVLWTISCLRLFTKEELKKYFGYNIWAKWLGIHGEDL